MYYEKCGDEETVAKGGSQTSHIQKNLIKNQHHSQ